MLVIKLHSKGIKMHEQIALLQFNNTEPQVMKYKSKSPITLDRIVKHIEKIEPSVNWERDSVTLIPKVWEENID